MLKKIGFIAILAIALFFAWAFYCYVFGFKYQGTTNNVEEIPALRNSDIIAIVKEIPFEGGMEYYYHHRGGGMSLIVKGKISPDDYVAFFNPEITFEEFINDAIQYRRCQGESESSYMETINIYDESTSMGEHFINRWNNSPEKAIKLPDSIDPKDIYARKDYPVEVNCSFVESVFDVENKTAIFYFLFLWH